MFISPKHGLALVAMLSVFSVNALAQSPGPSPLPSPQPFPASTAESPSSTVPIVPPASLPAAAASVAPVEPLDSAPQSIAHVTAGNGILPNDHGQVWREYDIGPYTLHAAGSRPEQMIVDWILRQTGYGAWHSEPLGILSATHTTLRVYHAPDMQATVSEMVDRFVNPQTKSQTFSIRVVSLASPNWREKFTRIMHALPVQSQGMQAWLLSREDASLLFADLRKRNDFREFDSPTALVINGQSTTVSTMHPHGYTGAVTLHPEELHPGFEPQVMQFNEGFSIDFNPLMSLDGQSADAMIRCDVDQLERVVPATLDVPTAIAPRQHTEIEVPQSSSYRLRQQFHFPANQVLLISFGIIAAPVASEPAIRLTFNPGPPRAELLAFVENRGTATSPLATVLPVALPGGGLPIPVAPPRPLVAPIAVPQTIPPPIPAADRRSGDPFYRSPY